jgi:hypothetical protein
MTGGGITLNRAKARKSTLTLEQMLKYIEDNSIPIPFCGCRIWMGRIDRRGYAAMSWQGAPTSVSRFVCEATHGPMPRRLVAGHVCDIPLCVEVTHIRPITQSQNALERYRRAPHA